jgi:hypothetical protein
MDLDVDKLNADKLHLIIDQLLDKHKSNSYVYGRLIHYIEHSLPAALENASELHKQREERRSLLSANRDEFTSRFLEKNNYFYSSQTELFLRYDGLHFVIQNEDDIHHQILSAISSEKCLREWRYKVTKNIIKRIKERSPLNVVPESGTIQFVINTLCPYIFSTRNHAKYFLTIIGECLGRQSPPAPPAEADNILSSTDINFDKTVCAQAVWADPPLYIFPVILKDIMREISNQCYSYLGLANIFSNIKYKYYDHNYSACRLLNVERKWLVKIPAPPNLTNYMLDFLSVAAHYYTRYGSADKFLQQCSDTKLVEHALFLTKNTHDSIVTTFIDKSLTFCSTGTIDMKNMIFIWKKFLSERNLPSIIFYDTLKTVLNGKLNYDELKDCFTCITSIHLPMVSQFMQFWEETILETEANDNLSIRVDNLCDLFKTWAKSSKPTNEMVLEIIQYFYPDISILHDTYILNIKTTFISGASNKG